MRTLIAIILKKVFYKIIFYMFKDIISAPRMFKDPRITSNGKYRYRLIDMHHWETESAYNDCQEMSNFVMLPVKAKIRVNSKVDIFTEETRA